MRTVTFCFGTHNHQPIGNFDHVIEEAYERSYLPFFKHAAKTDVRFATHFSGILLAWLEQHHPEHLDFLKSIVSRGQLEMIGGGYYEPILAVIPERDRLAQIEKLSTSIREMFGTAPNGMWLAERVWEQDLVSSIDRAGINYVILDDTHFRAAGLDEADLNGYYLTENNGRTIAVFPISKQLRYTIPFRDVDETIAVLRDAASEEGNSIVTFADDGEKFGVWPKTYAHVYTNGWLDEFFAKLYENRSWIRSRHFSEVLHSHRPKGRIYLPNASYSEMMQWSLPSAKAVSAYDAFVHKLDADPEEWSQYLQFVRGGYWRNFFVKYPESNHLHKRMLELSSRFTDELRSSDSYDHLLASQCNDAYWHGVFGGIYLPNLRHEVYSNLLAAEAELETLTGGKLPSVRHADLNGDGVADILVETDRFAISVDPVRGGCISELSYLPKRFNLTNIISRREEAYHAKLQQATSPGDATATASIHDTVTTKEKDLDKHLVYDWYRHGCMIDHFLSHDVTAEAIASARFLDHSDHFKAVVEPVIESADSIVTITSKHTGNVSYEGNSQSVHVEKRLTITNGSEDILVRYTIENRSDSKLRAKFASEWTFGLLTGTAHDRYYASPGVTFTAKQQQLRSTGIVTGARELSLSDEWTGFRIRLIAAEPCTIFRSPIETVASSEAGYERVYQGSVIFCAWDIALEAGESRSLDLTIRVIDI